MSISISVIVPVYNVEKYLDKCINSILKQSFRDFELILVDDGSTDNSLNICKSYKSVDSRVRIISKENMGLSSARNVGIKIAKGKYICFIDSDDFVQSNYLYELYDKITKFKADIAICEYFITNENGNKINVGKLNEPKSFTFLSGIETIKYLYRPNSLANIVAWNKIYKKALFNNLKYDEGRYFEDEFIIVPLLYSAKKICFVHEPLYNYVQRDGSIMNSKFTSKKLNDNLDFLIERINFFKLNQSIELYNLGLQGLKDSIVTILKSHENDISSDEYSKLQRLYKKIVKIKKGKSVKDKFKDAICERNIGLYIRLTKFLGR